MGINGNLNLKDITRLTLEVELPSQGAIYDTQVRKALLAKYPQFARIFFTIHQNSSNLDEFVVDLPNTTRNAKFLNDFKN